MSWREIMGDAAVSDKKTLHWNPQLERILACEGERALCFSWLHARAEKRYSRLSTYVALPVIVLSGVNGFISGIGGSIVPDPGALGIGVGALSLGIGILNTVGTYFGWAKRSESHRMVAIQYSKIHRSILIELSLPRDERIAAADMLKMIRDQLDRLHETSPQVPDEIIAEFRGKFGETTPEVSKPEITNGLDPIEVYTDEETMVRRIRARELTRETVIAVGTSPKVGATALSPKSSRTGALV